MDSHPDFLRFPEIVCEPDPRNAGLSVLEEGVFRDKTIKNQHAAVAALFLHEKVPNEIRIQFETSKNLYLYSWFVYRFYPVTLQHAYTCLEYALRERFEAEMIEKGERKQEFGPGLKRLLSYAVENEYLRDENFKVWRRLTENRARYRTINEQFTEMDRLGVREMAFEESKIEIKDVDRGHDYLGVLLETIPWLRNHYAHGSNSLHNQVLGLLDVVAEVINQIFPECGSSNQISGDGES